MKITMYNTPTETRENEYFTHFKNSKRVQWASFRNFK